MRLRARAQKKPGMDMGPTRLFAKDKRNHSAAWIEEITAPQTSSAFSSE